jgi:hypothetical protein
MSMSRLRALFAVPLVGAALLAAACGGDGEDRPAVDVITGSPGAGGAATGSVSASGADVAGPQPTQIPGAAYNVVSNVDVYFAIGLDLRDIRGLVAAASEGRKVDWAAVQAIYEQGKNQKRADGSNRSVQALLNDNVYAQFPNGASVYGSPTFIDQLIKDTIAGTGRSASLTENGRRNVMGAGLMWVVYGKALEELNAAKTRIGQGNLDPNTGAPHAVDEAYGAVAGATDGSGIRSYSLLGAATNMEIFFNLGGKVKNPMEAALTNAQKAAVAGDGAAFDKALADFKGRANATFYLAVLRYTKAVEIQNNAAAREGGIAEGWGYWQAIRSTVQTASPTAAKTVDDALNQSPDKAWPASLTSSAYTALNEPAVIAALGIPAEAQVKTPPTN